jgi:hypothetical protein
VITGSAAGGCQHLAVKMAPNTEAPPNGQHQGTKCDKFTLQTNFSRLYFTTPKLLALKYMFIYIRNPMAIYSWYKTKKIHSIEFNIQQYIG